MVPPSLASRMESLDAATQTAGLAQIAGGFWSLDLQAKVCFSLLSLPRPFAETGGSPRLNQTSQIPPGILANEHERVPTENTPAAHCKSNLGCFHVSFCSEYSCKANKARPREKTQKLHERGTKQPQITTNTNR